MKSAALLVLLVLLMTACSGPFMTASRKLAATEEDPLLWLEEIEGTSALVWVKEQSARTEGALGSDARFKSIQAQIRAIVTAKDRLPSVSFNGGWYYNFWQDGQNPKGLWRRTSEKEFSKTAPKWETVLDLDALSKQEGESWVFKGANCLPPAHERCLLSLSKGGKDAVVIREFNTRTKTFTPEGFNHLREAKTDVSWIDADRVFIATDWGPGSLTNAGYPRMVKLWKKGQKPEAGELVYEGTVQDMAAGASTIFRPEGKFHFVERRINFYEREAFIYELDSGKLKPLAVPNDSETQRVFKNRILIKLRSEWKSDDGVFPAGALVAVDPDAKASLVYAPAVGESIAQVSATRDHVYLAILRNVSSFLYEYAIEGAAWKSREILVPKAADLSIVDEDAFTEHLLVTSESFIQPPALAQVRDGALRQLKIMPERFDSTGMLVEQHFVASRDGVKVPYFLIRKKSSRPGPTLLYGYGGFEISETPFYLNSWGKVWIENGGAFVLANIRGGGEFGPEWHKAAILKNKQKSYDDFIAIAEDLIARKVTVPSKLAIMGGSNGGLLVSAVMVQRPDLFNGVICQVPLTDMLRYHKLLAGASWMAEFGDPQDPEMFPFIRAYSPYQNVRAGVNYPSILIHTSTKDDRVHPGHARKLATKLMGVGAPVYYFENTEGGHSAAADLEQRVKFKTLEMIYLMERLF